MTYHAGQGVFVRESVGDDIAHIAPLMRDADRAEIWASNRMTPEIALLKGIGCSTEVYTIEWNGRPIAMFGVAQVTPGVGAIWLLGTEDIKSIRMIFLRRICRRYVARFLKQFEILTNYVDAANDISLAWLRWLGAELFGPVPVGPDAVPFVRFEIKRGTVCAQ